MNINLSQGGQEATKGDSHPESRLYFHHGSCVAYWEFIWSFFPISVAARFVL